ncbi:MAG: hypothetical protein O7B98_00405 [Alphaproteobacteria bacterium]|nr:hypothetical protein [Alphaproteobacteria bacterium]
MLETQTSPQIIALIVLAAALTLYAWWLSDRQARRFRDFVSWIEDQRSEQWQSLPWTSRRLNRTGGVEQLRRNDLRNDPEFMTRYRQGKMVRRPQVVVLLAAVAAIGLLAIGIEYFGWAWQ